MGACWCRGMREAVGQMLRALGVAEAAVAAEEEAMAGPRRTDGTPPVATGLTTRDRHRAT
jgi:hypothetical protein